MRRTAALIILLQLASCAAPLRTSVAPFRRPHLLPNVQTIWQLAIAAEALDTEEKSVRVFGTDLRSADILAVQVIAENKGNEEYEINAAQIFAAAGVELYPAFNLNQAAQRVRESSIGTTVVGQAVVGALAGVLAGAAIGAAAGATAGDAGLGAGAGAAIGGAVGTSSGASAGASDRYTHQFRHELATQDFGDRVLFAGDLRQGFIYFQVHRYTALRVQVRNITERSIQIVEIPLVIEHRSK